MLEIITSWLRDELREMKKVPVAIFLFVALAFGAGWWSAGLFYAERIQVLQLQRDAAEAGIVRPIAAPPLPPTMLVPHVSLRVAMVLALAIALVVFLAWRNGRLVASLRTEAATREPLLQTLTQERDDAVVALKDRKHEYAIETLERHAGLRIEGPQPTVTIRYANYGKDHDLAQRIKGLFTQYVKWPVTLEVQSSPALPRADLFKVVFDVGMTYFTYGPLIHAIAEGDLLDGVTIGKREFTDREDSHHLIVLVLPSAGSQPIKADPA